MVGAVAGAPLYTVANALITRHGGQHRKRSGKQPGAGQGGGLAIAAGAFLDGIPESVVLGVGMLDGAGSAWRCLRRSSCQTSPKVYPVPPA